MSELLVALGAGLVWCLPFAMLVLWVGPLGRARVGPAVLAAYPIFFAFQVLLAKAASAVGLLHVTGFRTAYGVLVAAGGAVCFLRLRRGTTAPAPAPAPAVDQDADLVLIRRIVLGVAALALALLALFALVAPVHVWDVLAYHMPMVASYVQNGSLDAWPTQELRQVYRVNAGELQLLNVALLARSDAWVELPNVLGLAVFLVAAYELARLALRRRLLAYLVAALSLTAPQVLVGAATAKNDLMFSAVLLTAFYWMIRAGRREDAGHAGTALGLAALCAALAAATKVMGLNVIGATGLVALAFAFRGRLRWGQVVAFTLMTTASLLLLAGDVYWRNLIRDTIPVGIAPGELHLSVGLGNLVVAARYYVYDLSFKRLVTPPIFEHDFLHYGYLFPFLLILSVVGAVRQWRRRDHALASLALAGGALFASVVAIRLPIGWDQRFMLWMIPVAAVLALSLAERTPTRNLLALCGLVAGLALVNVSTALTLESDRLFHRSVEHLATTGELARYTDVANTRYRNRDDGFEVLALEAAPTDTVLYAGTDDSWMYLAWGPRFTRRVEGVRDAAHAASQVASRRFDFIVMERSVPPEIERAIVREAGSAGYATLAQAEGRLIMRRSR
jgi:hypothetical protein